MDCLRTKSILTGTWKYRNEYLARYIVKPSMEFFYDAVEYQAGQKPDNHFPSSVG